MKEEDDKIAPEKNKKRMVKTPAQVEALEKFYDEHKYPTEEMKARLAESISLTEKQVSGWFCHRRLKDKKSVTGETPIPVKHERPSGVMQDRGSGLKQDSCGSTKQGEDKNFDTREVESGPKEFSATGLTYEHGNQYTENNNHINDPSSGSSSSLRNMPNHQSVDPFDSPMSNGYAVPKVWPDVTGVKRRGPSGYLKLKSKAENPAITAVKRKLGKLFQEDGPPLGVQFDPLPPGAFESSTNEETYYPGEAVLPSSDVARTYQNTKIGSVYNYKSSPALYNSNTGRINYKMSGGNDESGRYAHQRFVPPRTSIPEGSGYYPPTRNSPVASPEIPNGNEYRTKPRSGIEIARIDPVLSHPRFQPNNGKVKDKQDDSRFYKYNDASARVCVTEEIDNGFPNLTMKRKEFRRSLDRGQLGRTKDGKMYADKRVVEDDDDFPPPKRVKEDFSQQLQKTIPAAFENPQQPFRGVRSLEASCGFISEDEESAETSSWVE